MKMSPSELVVFRTKGLGQGCLWRVAIQGFPPCIPALDHIQGEG